MPTTRELRRERRRSRLVWTCMNWWLTRTAESNHLPIGYMHQCMQPACLRVMSKKREGGGDRGQPRAPHTREGPMHLPLWRTSPTSSERYKPARS